MRYLVSIIAILLIFGGQAAAQATAYTVAAFPSSATNPATATPLAPPVTYPVAQLTCGQAKVAETLPIINPYEGRFDDPANPALDCAVPIEPQILALPVGSGYKVAYRALVGATPSPWSVFTSPFAVAPIQAHPCDGTPPTSGTVVAGNRTISWCWNGLDANGTATTVTTWTVTINGTPVVLSGVTVSATANAQGKRLYMAPITLAAGLHSIRIAGTNSVGQSAFSAVFTVNASQPAAVPSVSEIRSIQ